MESLVGKLEIESIKLIIWILIFFNNLGVVINITRKLEENKLHG